MNQTLLQKLKTYFEKREDVMMAFVFGSQAKQTIHSSSDWDIGVYFKPELKDPFDPNNTRLHGTIEYEETDREYPEENKVWSDCIDILNTDNVDLVILNRAPASIADSVIREGIPLVIKDKKLYLDFMLLITNIAEDYRYFVEDYYAISQRSSSLSASDRERLIKTIDFIEKEMSLYSYFSNFNQKIYEDEILKRHEVEKWLENILTAIIDIAKILTGSEKQLIPDTYRKAVSKAIQLLNLSDDFANNFDNWVKLRNIVVHEYLDIKWKKISNFIQNSESYLQEFIKKAKEFLKNQE